MLLTEKEMSVLKDLQTQEKNCIDKYEKYAGLAKIQQERTISQRAVIQRVKSQRIKRMTVFLQQTA